jgi:hypothetical protein
MPRRKPPAIPDEVLDQLLGGSDPRAALAERLVPALQLPDTARLQQLVERGPAEAAHVAGVGDAVGEGGRRWRGLRRGGVAARGCGLAGAAVRGVVGGLHRRSIAPHGCER